MIWRLTYCNKEGVEARVDIIKGNRTPIEVVKGSGNPFTLSYKLDKNDKSGHIMTSSADVEIFETDTFNIDDLKTSNETELKVEYFKDNVLTWSGFILPDFFSREIGSPNIVRMTASDRLTALKGVTLSDLPSRVSLKNLLERCLNKTGLTLSLASQIQINQGSTNILDSEVLSQRLTDVRGRSISCYDILMSIMVATNSTIRQRKGQWQVYNKLEHEQRTPTIFFDKVERGAMRTIQPVASSVGVYQEYGGGRLHPDNYDFAQGLSGWSTVGGFNAAIGDKLIKEFTAGSSGGAIISIVPDNNVTIKAYLINNNEYIRNINPKYIESANIDIPYTGYGVININVDVNATGPAIAHPSRPSAFMRIAVVAIKGTTVKTLDHGGAFIDMPSENPPVFAKEFERGTDFTNIRAVTSGMIVNGKLEIPEGDSFSNWKIRVRVYGGGGGYDVAFNSTMVKLSLSATDSPKGNIFKTTQGANYTKLHDVETTIFGDYITSGLNGYFYDYPIDDTSILYLPNGETSSPTWETIFDTTERPLLHHISRQKSRLFSVAHDILKANINVDSFDPLAIFQDCKGGKYVIVSASFDFLRSEVDVELEQIAYDNTILKRDFIYSYFGEGEDTIKSIGGIAGGGGGTGGGSSAPQYWTLDEDGNLKTEYNAYSTKGLSALGLGEDGGGGGGSIDMLDSWANYTTARANYYVPASLLVPFRSDTLSRLTSLEAGGGASNIEIATAGAGNAITAVSKSGNTLTFAKGSTFSLSNHNHNTLYKPIGYAPSWSEITGKPTTLSGYGITDGALNTLTLTAGNGLTGGGTLNANRTLTLGTPSTLTATSGNSSSGTTHTHKIDTTTTGEANKVVATDGSGGTELKGLIVSDLNYQYEESSDALMKIINPQYGGASGRFADLMIGFNVYARNARIRAVGEDAYGRVSRLSLGVHNSTETVPETLSIHRNGNVGIGTTSPAYKLDVSGTGRFTGNITASAGVNTPKVIFAAAGWSLEQVGMELQMKHNGVIKQRMLSNGTILATGGITALST